MADPLDLLTLDEGKTAINMSFDNANHEEEIARQITAVSRIIDEACGPVVVRTVTEELHEIGAGQATVYLDELPVQSVTTVDEFDGTTLTTLAPVAFAESTSGYFAGAGVLARRLSGQAYIWPNGGTVRVTYEAGRYASTETVDARFKEAAAAVLRRLWKREAGAWAQSSSFFEDADGQVSSGFFRVARPIIEEMLAGEIRDALPGIA